MRIDSTIDLGFTTDSDDGDQGLEAGSGAGPDRGNSRIRVSADSGAAKVASEEDRRDADRRACGQHAVVSGAHGVFQSAGWKESESCFSWAEADGTESERIADAITTNVIDKCDYLLDLHCGDGNESLRPYVYQTVTGDAAFDERIAELVAHFGFDHIVIDRNRPKDRGEFDVLFQYCDYAREAGYDGRERISGVDG